MDFIRKYRVIFSVVFILSALGLVMSDFGRHVAGLDFGMGGGIMARVGDFDIKTTEFERDLNMQLKRVEEMISQQTASDPSQAEMMRNIMRMQINPDSVLNRLIEDRFRKVLAMENGVRVSGEQIRSALSEMEVFQKNGKFDPVHYKQLLAANGLRPGDFEKQIATEIEVQTLQSSLMSNLSLQSDLEFSQEELLGQRKIFEIAVISPKNLPDAKLPDEATLKAFTDDLNNRVHFDAYYNEHIEDFRKQAAIQARHILFADTPDGKKMAESVLGEIKGGKITFEEAAKKHSLDKANAGQGGDLGYFEKGVMDPEFEKAAFGLVNPNDLSGVVKSSFGYHLIQLLAKRAEINRTLETVMNEIAPKVWLENEKRNLVKNKLNEFVQKANGPQNADLKFFKTEWKEVPSAWTPMDDRLGPYTGISSHVADLIRLNEKAPFLKKPIEKAGTWVLVRFKKSENSAPQEANPRDMAIQRKAQEVIGFYFEDSFRGFEKAKKISRGEANLARYREAFKKKM